MFTVTRQVHQCFSQRLAGDSASVDTNAAHHIASFDDSHALAQPRRLNGCAVTGGTAPYHDQVVIVHAVFPREYLDLPFMAAV